MRHTREGLQQMQSVPLEGKIIMSQLRIRQWYDYWGGEVYLSFSGGKDSTVLKHLIETTSGVYDVPVVFVDTGLEYPEVRMFATKNADVVLRPEMRFDEVIEKYGYPVISKKIAGALEDAKRNIPLGKETARVKCLYGTYGTPRRDGKPSMWDYSKYKYLIDAPFKISNKCCDVMKKSPIKKYARKTGRKPIIGTMATESLQRRSAWLKTGCNAFGSKSPTSQPMSFWTEQDVLEYIVKFNLDYAKVYGEIKQDESGKYYTTGVDRTGCMFCMFGCHLEKEPNRFQKMKETHPRQYEYCMNKLGLKDVLEYINVPYE